MDDNTFRFFKERYEAIKATKDELREKGPFFQSEMAQYTIQLAFEKGSEWTKRRTIEKAVKWLKENESSYWSQEYDTPRKLLDDFVKAMEE